MVLIEIGIENLDYFKSKTSEEVFSERKNKFLKIGRSKGFMSNLEDLSTLKVNKNFNQLFQLKKTFIIGFGISAITIALLFYFLYCVELFQLNQF